MFVDFTKKNLIIPSKSYPFQQSESLLVGQKPVYCSFPRTSEVSETWQISEISAPILEMMSETEAIFAIFLTAEFNNFLKTFSSHF